VPLLALAIAFGVYPNLVLRYMQKSVDNTVVQLTEWTQKTESARSQQDRPQATASANTDGQPEF
jgi:hypothetical protein